MGWAVLGWAGMRWAGQGWAGLGCSPDCNPGTQAKVVIAHTLSAVCRFEYEQVSRAKDVIAHGGDMASDEEKETYLYKPTFKQLWKKEV